MTTILILAPEILERVAALLDIKDLCSLRQTCSYLRDICDLESIWTVKAKNDFSVECDSVDKEGIDRKSTRLNSSHSQQSRMPSSA